MSDIKITSEAIAAIKTALESEYSILRISVIGSGCSGLQYQMEPETEVRSGDIELVFEDLKVVIDPISMNYLEGTTIEYKSTLQQSGFVFNNPKAVRQCGCKKSFGV